MFQGEPSSSSPNCKYFKDKKSFATRKKDADSAKELHSDKLPLIIERFQNEKALPMLDKIKFLVPFDMTVGTLMSIIRKRLQLNSSQALFLLFGHKHIFSASGTMLDIYRDHKDNDGFLTVPLEVLTHQTFFREEVFHYLTLSGAWVAELYQTNQK